MLHKITLVTVIIIIRYDTLTDVQKACFPVKTEIQPLIIIYHGLNALQPPVIGAHPLRQSIFTNLNKPNQICRATHCVNLFGRREQVNECQPSLTTKVVQLSGCEFVPGHSQYLTNMM